MRFMTSGRWACTRLMFIHSFPQTYSRRETINRSKSGRARITRRQLRAHEFVDSRSSKRASKPTNVRSEHTKQPQSRLSSQISYGESEHSALINHGDKTEDTDIKQSTNFINSCATFEKHVTIKKKKVGGSAI